MQQLVTIVETLAFQRDAERHLSVEEIEALKDYLSANPEAGVVIPQTGGVRKLRWAVSGRGKRGGARIIYYFHNMEIPLFLISIFIKGQKSDLSPDELKAARQFAEAIAREAKNRG